jgi:N-acetylglucosaminyldiphosphoundecaprenol N-acetyl-beta-D-mannosaminyltransferase
MTVGGRVVLGGIGFDVLTEGETVDHVFYRLRSGQGGRVVTPNIDVLHQVAHDVDLARLVVTSDLVVADGMPLVWAARLQGTPLPERVAGSALSVSLCARAADEGVRVLLIGGNEGNAGRAAQRLRAQHPSLEVGIHFPPFGFEGDRAECQRVRQAVADFGPALVLVGLTFKKQEELISELRPIHSGSWFVGVGASIDFLAAEFTRAPLWMQQRGLEWVHRLVIEPRRLWRRYLRDDGPFALRLLFRSTLARRRSAPRA